MSMSDCEKCWDTPCRCGHGYKHWSVGDLAVHILMLTTMLNGKLNPPETAKGNTLEELEERFGKPGTEGYPKNPLIKVAGLPGDLPDYAVDTAQAFFDNRTKE